MKDNRFHQVTVIFEIFSCRFDGSDDETLGAADEPVRTKSVQGGAVRFGGSNQAKARAYPNGPAGSDSIKVCRSCCLVASIGLL